MALLKKAATKKAVATEANVAAAPKASVKAESKTYRVQIIRGEAFPSRSRAGIVVLNDQEGYVGPLTDEQLAAVKADAYLTVDEYKA